LFQNGVTGSSPSKKFSYQDDRVKAKQMLAKDRQKLLLLPLPHSVKALSSGGVNDV